VPKDGSREAWSRFLSGFFMDPALGEARGR
jgi:hypothetical protein